MYFGSLPPPQGKYKQLCSGIWTHVADFISYDDMLHFVLKELLVFCHVAQSAGAVEYTDCISGEGQGSPNKWFSRLGL